MKLKKAYRLSLTTLLFLSLQYSIFCLSPTAGVAQEEQTEINNVLETLRSQPRHKSLLQQFTGKSFSINDIKLDLPPDAVLATAQGEPLVYVEEFNKRAGLAPGDNLYQVRYNALRKIIDTKLVAAMAREDGFKNTPGVIKKVSSAKGEVESLQAADKYKSEISDLEAQRYYTQNIEDFREADLITRVLFVVKPDRKQALDILEQIKNKEAFEKFCFSAKPLAGRLFPKAVQEAIFHLEPGQVSEVIDTPIGFYIIKLLERNAFDQFEASIIVKNKPQECQQVLKKIEAGEEFEKFVEDKEHLSVASADLPLDVQRVLPTMELKEISPPIATPLGCFLVKLQKHRASAEILSARLIRVSSESEGIKLSSRLNQGIEIEETEEQDIDERDLPAELLDMARSLKIGEYSLPVKTPLGYYLIKVQKRARQFYKPFNAVKDEVKQRVIANEISDDKARNYYHSNSTLYLKPDPEYIVEPILADTLDQGKKILAKLEATSDMKDKQALFAGYQKDLKKVALEILPPACQEAAKTLQPGQPSPVIETKLGFYILRQKEKLDPAYLPFEAVKLKIKSLLAEQAEQRDKHEAQIYVNQVEENALARAYFTANVIQKADTVSDEEADKWSRNNPDALNLFGISGEESQDNKMIFESPEKTMLFKKSNYLLAKYKDMINELYVRNNVLINKHLLN